MFKSGRFLRRLPGPGPLETLTKRRVSAPQESLMPVIFKGTGGYIVTGPESKQVYCFSPHDPELMIDARDAEALLKTGLFCVNC